MRQIDVREGARRQHRSLALFAVVECWRRDLDGLAFERSQLARVIGLKRFKATRVEWMQKDFKEFFPYQKVFYDPFDDSAFHSLIVARKPFWKHLPRGDMSVQSRVERMNTDGPRIEMFEIWAAPKAPLLKEKFGALAPFFAESANYDERFLSAYLALLAQGQISPSNLPPLSSGPARLPKKRLATNVLFVNVGAGVNTGIRCPYDGTEGIEGGHGWLAEHSEDCAEMAMFSQRATDAMFYSHAGPGGMKPADVPFDVVFVARDGDVTGQKKHAVLGMYLDAEYVDNQGFAVVKAAKAIIIPPSERGKLHIRWSGRVRMWARRSGETRYPKLVKIYQRLPGRFPPQP